MLESITEQTTESYVSQEKARTLLGGSFYHSQGLSVAQDVLAIGLRLLHKGMRINPEDFGLVVGNTSGTAQQMEAKDAHLGFSGADPRQETRARMEDMIAIVNRGELPKRVYFSTYNYIPRRYAPEVAQENPQIPTLENAGWVWYGILSYMVERDSYYICPDEHGNIRGRSEKSKDLYDSQFCRLILQQDNAYTPEYTKVMQQVRAFLRRELPQIQAHEPELYEKMEAVITQYNVLPHKQEIRQASLDQLQEADKE